VGTFGSKTSLTDTAAEQCSWNEEVKPMYTNVNSNRFIINNIQWVIITDKVTINTITNSRQQQSSHHEMWHNYAIKAWNMCHQRDQQFVNCIARPHPVWLDRPDPVTSSAGLFRWDVMPTWPRLFVGRVLLTYKNNDYNSCAVRTLVRLTGPRPDPVNGRPDPVYQFCSPDLLRCKK